MSLASRVVVRCAGGSARWLSGRGLLGFAALIASLTCAEPAAAVYKFCATIQPVYQDSGVGEDYLVSGTVPAYRHFMRVWLGNSVINSGYADSAGCAPGTYSGAGTYRLEVQTKVGWGSGANITTAEVHKDDDAWHYAMNYTWSNLPAHSGSTVTKSANITGTTLDGLFRVTAVLSRVPANSLVAGQTYTIFGEVLPTPGLCVACAQGGTIWLGVEAGWYLNRKKTVVAHEFGHLVQESLTGFFGQSGVSVADTYCASVSASTESTCRCDQVAASPGSGYCGGEQWDRLHCINSREFMFAAFNEGFAHFYATTLLNNTSETTATFPYYKKQISDTGQFVWLPPVHHAVLPSTPHRWMENQCPGTMARRGTEMDWLSFLYYLHTQTSNKYSFVEIRTVMQDNDVCNGWCTSSDDVTWNDMTSGVNSQGWAFDKRNHFNNNGATYGVDH